MNHFRTQLGASMIEVLVSLAVVAFGLLGLAGLQARSMSFQKDSFDRKAAAEMVAQLAERVRANYDGFKAGNYNLTFKDTDGLDPIPVCGDPLNCTPAEAAARDWAMWRVDLRRRLPVSAAFLTAPANSSQITLVMAWQEGQTKADVADTLCDSVGINDATFRCTTWIINP
jgi:type IV pilus assembly protein PilV